MPGTKQETDEKNVVQVNASVTPEVLTKIERIAKKEDRSKGQVAGRLIAERLKGVKL